MIPMNRKEAWRPHGTHPPTDDAQPEIPVFTRREILVIAANSFKHRAKGRDRCVDEVPLEQ